MKKQTDSTVWRLFHTMLGALGVVCLFVATTFVVGVPLIVAVDLAGCAGTSLQTEAVVADAITDSANAALPILVEQYRQEGLSAIDRVADSGGTAAEARAATDEVKARWEPVWDRWERLRIAQNAWATAIELGGDTVAALEALRGAYCELLVNWPKQVRAMPLAPIACPGVA